MEDAAPSVSRPEARSGGRFARRFLATVVVIAALYGVLLGVVAPPIAKRVAAERMGERLGRVVQIDAVSVNPYTLAATVRGFRVLEADGKSVFVSLDALAADASVSSAWRLAPVIDALGVSGLRVNVVRDGEAHFNFSDILARLAESARVAAKARAGKEEEAARFSIANLQLVNVSIDVDDRPKGKRHRISDMAIAVPFISSLPVHRKHLVQPAFSAKVNGAAVRIAGDTLPFEDSLQTRFDVRLTGA
jgi:uncharacterized protein involved in outer membrane biogenesis